jgi:hypothetical protein
MQTHYEHYLLGCRAAGVKPLSFWRFSLAYGKYQREVRAKLDRHWDSLSPKDRHQLVIECRWLIEIDNLVQKGAKIAEFAARERDSGDEPGTAGAGTCEPRIPDLSRPGRLRRPPSADLRHAEGLLRLASLTFHGTKIT